MNPLRLCASALKMSESSWAMPRRHVRRTGRFCAFLGQIVPFFRAQLAVTERYTIAPLTPKRGENSSKFQYFLDERAYWNAPFFPARVRVRLLSLFFWKIMAQWLPFVKDIIQRGVMPQLRAGMAVFRWARLPKVTPPSRRQSRGRLPRNAGQDAGVTGPLCALYRSSFSRP